MLVEALENNGVDKNEVFPPGISRQKHLNKIQLRYLRSVIKRLIKQDESNRSLYNNELGYFLKSDASLITKLEGTVSTLWKILRIKNKKPTKSVQPE